jgi:hypothetical protein
MIRKGRRRERKEEMGFDGLLKEQSDIVSLSPSSGGGRGEEDGDGEWKTMGY